MPERLPKRYKELSALLGEEAAIKLCEEYGGDTPYIPKADGFRISKRNRQIRKEYNGYNKTALSQKYHLTQRSIELILKQDSDI